MILKMTPKNHTKEWYGFFKLTSIFLIIIAYFYFRDGTDNLFVFYILLGIQFLPTAYLHIMYYFENKGEEYSIERDKIVRIKNNKKKFYSSNDIKKIVICKSASQDGWGIPYTTFETFRIARVYLKDGSDFIITNLLEYELEKPLKILQNVKFERRRGFSFFI